MQQTPILGHAAPDKAREDAESGLNGPEGRSSSVPPAPAVEPRPVEIGGRDGPDPTRYGDWEKNGRCIDF